jgi:16S rRNA (guanine527-N7)-methyltransferase
MSSPAQDSTSPLDETGFAEDVLEHLRPHLAPLLEELLPEGKAPDAGVLAADLARFCTALAAANRSINLTGITDAEGMAIRHCLDSMVALPHLVPRAGEAASPPPLVDIGSGCGVPGIPLALARPDLPVVLIESRLRKSEAIAGLVQSLQLGPRVQLVHARAEAWLKEHDVGTLVTRAVGPVNTQLELFGPLRTRYRRLVMLKGPAAREELEQAAKTRHKHRFPEPAVHETELPGGAGKRVVLVFEGGRS